MPEEQQPNKSTRSFEEWKLALEKLVSVNYEKPLHEINVIDEKVKPYYNQGLMPDVCFKELFNR
jgi:hypothetical protein